jgi:PPOX class probable FMN-dependent enzyme
MTRLDKACRRFIAKSPFVVVGSVGAWGHLDLSPKGDPAGFVHVLDDSTLVVPDRAGNRRVDTFHNVLQNPRVGLIFFVPSKRETLRAGGSAVLVRDQGIRNAMATNGRAPELVMIRVDRAFFHCDTFEAVGLCLSV